MRRNTKLKLGIHTGHDANIALMDEQGNVVFAAGEERFNRKKMYAGFPSQAIEYVTKRFSDSIYSMTACRMSSGEKLIRELAFFANSFRKQLAAPRFLIWVKNGFRKLRYGRSMESGAKPVTDSIPDIIQNVEHHHAHAAGAFYPSGFERAYVMTLDGEGDGYSCCFYHGSAGALKRYRSYFHNEITIGRDYEKVTAMLGFHPIRHPGKITGLAAYGTYNESCIDMLQSYLKAGWQKDRKRIFSTSEAYQVMSPEGRKSLIIDRETQFKAFSREDLAFAVQYLTEKRVLNLIKTNIPDPSHQNIALAGGVFANVALNKKIKELGFRKIFIQPAMTDCGLSLGSLLYSTPSAPGIRKKLEHVYLGPSYTAEEIRSVLENEAVSYQSPDNLPDIVAEMLAEGKVIARFDGAMEFGPRALGNRSILYHTGDPSVNDWLNKQLCRTEFMPFAPVLLRQYAKDYLHGLDGAEHPGKFMTITFDCTEKMKKDCPAVVHVDGTARPQILDPEDNPGYGAILQSYYKLTGIPALVNTSFNMHEEPIVMTPEQALRAFHASRLDAMIMGPFLIQPAKHAVKH